MKKILFCTFCTALLISCNNNSPDENQEDNKNTEDATESFDDKVKRHIEGNLSIPATEKYTYHVFKQNLDGDDKEDAIITVNRLDFAIDEASKSKNSAKNAQMGFMGNYNFIFYYDGGLDKISPQIPIPSSPISELKVTFENIHSENYKDILVQFRVLNGGFTDFFTVQNHTPTRVFQWKNFDGLKKQSTEAFYFEFAEGTITDAKDILIKKGTFVQPSTDFDIYKFEPEIQKTDELVYRFFYHPDEGKYMTKKGQ